jgi:TFIIIC subunit triple barrel domain
MKDEDDVPRTERQHRKKKRKDRMYRLGSRGLEDVEYDYKHGDDEDMDDDDLSNSDDEGEDGEGPGDAGVEAMEVERESIQPEVDDLEAAGFHLDPENIISDADEEDKNEEKEYNKFQISELHSETPLVAFRGKYYDCQWARNIGTEMLFTKHDPDDPDPLPSLRTLPGDVDLLAASSVRIMSKEVKLVPKVQKSQKIRRPRLKVKDLAIEVGEGARRERKEQAKFLEELINIKLAKGELDAVTVEAVGRKSVWKWKEYFKQQHAQEIKKLKKLVRKGGKDASEAATKLQALEEEEKRRDASDELRKQGKPSKDSQKRKGVPGGAPKPKRGRPALGKLRQITPEILAPTNFGTPGSGIGTMARSSPGDFDSDFDSDEDEDEDEDSKLNDKDIGLEDSDEGDSEDRDSEEEDTEQEDSEGEDIEQGDSNEDQGEEGESDEVESNEDQSSDGPAEAWASRVASVWLKSRPVAGEDANIEEGSDEDGDAWTDENDDQNDEDTDMDG